jgi:hypothetical protein
MGVLRGARTAYLSETIPGIEAGKREAEVS